MSRLKRMQTFTVGLFAAVALNSTAVLAQSNSSAQAGDAADAGAAMAEQGKQTGEARSKEAKNRAKQERNEAKSERKATRPDEDEAPESAENLSQSDSEEMKEKGGQGKADPGNKGSEKGIEKKRENSKAWWNFWA